MLAGRRDPSRVGIWATSPSIPAQTWIMDLDALRASPIGQLVPIAGTDGRTGVHYDSFAYPLPESVQLGSETWTIVARAEAALARLDQAARQVPSPELLRDPAIRREAQSTSALEGTFAPFATVLEEHAGSRLPCRASLTCWSASARHVSRPSIRLCVVSAAASTPAAKKAIHRSQPPVVLSPRSASAHQVRASAGAARDTKTSEDVRHAAHTTFRPRRHHRGRP